MPNLPRVFISCLMIVVLGLCLVTGFYALFSNFRAYDDEGVLLLANKLFLEGGSFYTDIPWIYGPGYLASVRLLHDWLAVPLTHSAVRYTTLCYWILLCSVSSLLVYKLSRSWLWSVAAFILVFLFTQSFVNEPGHPQGLIAVGTILIPLAVCYAGPGSQKFIWFFIGTIAAVIFHIKVNAGVFSIAAVAVVLACNFSTGYWQKLLVAALVAASVLFPFVLMFPLLSEPNALPFAMIIALGLGSTSIIVMSHNNPGVESRTDSIAFFIGVLMATVLAYIFSAMNGATPFDIYSSLFSYSNSQIEFYHFFREYSRFQLVSAGLSFVLALWYRYGEKEISRQWIAGLGKTYFVSLALYSIIINGPANANAMLGYAGPWCWVLATRLEHYELPLGRLLLASTAVWSPLLAYPIPGSQIYFGSLAILLAALACSSDLVAGIVHRWGPAEGSYISRVGQGIPLLGVLLAIIVLSYRLEQTREEYYRFKPLGLPGTHLIRIEPRRGQIYRKLVEELNGADVALTTFRFNSFYLWSSAAMAGSIYTAHSLANSLPVEQVSIKADLLRAIRPIVVKRKETKAVKTPQADILLWIEDNFEAYREIGPYVLMKPRRD